MLNTNLRPHWRKLLVAAVTLLGLRVLAGIVMEYRLYFPPNFREAAFLVGREATFTNFYATAFYIHILAGPPVILLAGFLLWSGRQKRLREWHRLGARVLMVLIFAALLPSGLIMARNAFAGPIAGLGFAALTLATAICAGCTWYYARARRYAVHERWALRTFLLLVSPLVLRVVSGVFIVTGYEEPIAYIANAWLSWLLPLALYEVWLRFRQTTQPMAAHADAAFSLSLQTPSAPPNFAPSFGSDEAPAERSR